SLLAWRRCLGDAGAVLRRPSPFRRTQAHQTATKSPSTGSSYVLIGAIRNTMRTTIGLVCTILVLAAASAGAQTLRLDRDGGFSFKFGRDDRRGDVEGKRASCEVYARIAVVQADASARFRCGLRGPAWVSDPAPHFRWCRFVPRRRIAEEQRSRADQLQRCFDRLGDFDDDRWAR
ncbi:MAG: hypothetical protein WC684_02810, partial [Hyphomicrobium sp.]